MRCVQKTKGCCCSCCIPRASQRASSALPLAEGHGAKRDWVWVISKEQRTAGNRLRIRAKGASRSNRTTEVEKHEHAVAPLFQRFRVVKFSSRSPAACSCFSNVPVLVDWFANLIPFCHILECVSRLFFLEFLVPHLRAVGFCLCFSNILVILHFQPVFSSSSNCRVLFQRFAPLLITNFLVPSSTTR